MDKLRVDFEADFENETGWSAGEYPSQEVVSLCWLLYRQSRASIVVALPFNDIQSDETDELWDRAVESCAESLRSIGLSIKGE